jgi:hypothetical protein
MSPLLCTSHATHIRKYLAAQAPGPNGTLQARFLTPPYPIHFTQSTLFQPLFSPKTPNPTPSYQLSALWRRFSTLYFVLSNPPHLSHPSNPFNRTPSSARHFDRAPLPCVISTERSERRNPSKTTIQPHLSPVRLAFPPLSPTSTSVTTNFSNLNSQIFDSAPPHLSHPSHPVKRTPLSFPRTRESISPSVRPQPFFGGSFPPHAFLHRSFRPSTSPHVSFRPSEASGEISSKRYSEPSREIY